MRLRKLSVIAATAALVFVASCQKKSADYLRFIPDDAVVVVGTNVQSLLDKSDVLSHQQVKDAIIGSAEQELSGAGVQLVKSIVDNPAESGLDLSRDLYFWLEDIDGNIGGFVMALTDKEKFMKLIDVTDTSGDPMKFTSYNGYMIGEDDEIGVAIGDGFALIYGGTSAATSLDALKNKLEEKTEDNFSTSATYKKMASLGADMTMMFSLEELVEESGYAQAYGSLPKDVPLADVDGLVGLNFEAGKVVVDYSYVSETGVWDKWVKENAGYVSRVDGTMMDYLGQDALGVLFASMDGKGVTKMLEQYPEYARVFDELNLPFDLKHLLSTIDGQIGIGVNSFNLIPEVVLCAEVSNEDIMNTMTAQLGGTEVAEGKYVANVEMLSIYYGMEDGKFYASLSPNSREGLKAADPSFADNKHSGTARGSYGYVGFNMKAFMMLPFAENLRYEVGTTGFTLLKSIDYIELYATDLAGGKLVVYTNSNENPLKIVTDLLIGVHLGRG